MPFFSIVLTAYNNGRYLPDCLNSLTKQTLVDWECIIVNDASPDSTSEIAHSFAKADDRFKVLDLRENQGRHLARKIGVDECSGKYVIFLDADDEFAIDGLSQLAQHVRITDADIVHFGINVIAAGVKESDCESFESYINQPLPDANRNELIKRIFAKDGGFKQDWRVTQCSYSQELVSKAFGVMANERLDRAEDCYELLVLADLSNGQHVANDIRLLNYYYGRGITGTSVIEKEKFNKSVDDFAFCINAIKSYCGNRLESEFDGVIHKLMDLLFNDWAIRLGNEDKLACAHYAAEKFGYAVAAEQVMRIARDRAYRQLSNEGRFETESDECLSLYRLGENLAKQSENPSASYENFHAKATDHLNNLERRTAKLTASNPTLIKKSSYEAQPIRIFVTTHKDVETFRSDILQPVQVGARQPRERLLWAYQDDNGENIADRNSQFCELTTQYWAWKNTDAQYYGFCHYRRYFDFSADEHEENPYGEVMDKRINFDSQSRYCLHDDEITDAVTGFDVITTGIKDLRKFPEHYASAYDHYKRAPYLKIEHLERIIEILKADHPDYAEDADTYLKGHETCFCNMYIMSKEYFNRYCEWLFPMLFKFADEWDTSLLSQEALRTPGHLSERLFNIWLLHEKRVNPNLKHKQVQCVHFEHPECYSSPVLPAINNREKPVVPVVFAADNNYVPMVTTTVYSMLKNASPDCFYDVVILDTDFTEANKEIMRGFFAQFENMSLRFAGVAGMIEEYNLKTSNAHISVETYYRFLIQKILPDYEKVLYLDSDLIIKGDIAQLFNIDLKDNLIGAARDTDFLGNLSMNDGNRLEYARRVLLMSNPYDYFQAGVLVMNLKEMRKLHSFTQWLEYAAEPKYIYDDQDILNAHCQGRVTYINNEWNVMNDCGGRIKKVFSFAPVQVYQDFLTAYDNPKIVHYAGCEKPWKPGGCDLSTLYWSYARQTPFYEQLISIFIGHATKAIETRTAIAVEALREQVTPDRAISENNPLRESLDKVLPMGSRRREAIKSCARFVRGRR